LPPTDSPLRVLGPPSSIAVRMLGARASDQASPSRSGNEPMRTNRPKRVVYAILLAGAIVLTLLLYVLPWTARSIGERLGWSIRANSVLLGGMVLALVSLSVAGKPVYDLWQRRKEPKPGFCPQCGYCLIENETGKCPECGTSLEVVVFLCAVCGRKAHVPASLRGRKFDCPHCAATVQLARTMCGTCEREVYFPAVPRGRQTVCPHCAAATELLVCVCEHCLSNVIMPVSLRGQTRQCPFCGTASPIP